MVLRALPTGGGGSVRACRLRQLFELRGDHLVRGLARLLVRDHAHEPDERPRREERQCAPACSWSSAGAGNRAGGRRRSLPPVWPPVLKRFCRPRGARAACWRAAGRRAADSVGTVRPGASRSRRAAAAYSARTAAVIRNGVDMLLASTSFTVVRALRAVPPVLAPKTPMARPRRSGGNQALTSGTPTAKAVPPIPRKNPPMSRAVREECPARPRWSTGTVVAADTIGEHDPSAEPVGQCADRDPARRTDGDRHRHQQRLLER